MIGRQGCLKGHLGETAVFLLVLASACAALAFDGWEAARRGPAGRDLNAIYFADAKRGWIAGDDGFLSRTEDGGRSWSAQRVGTTDAINDVYFRNKEQGYLLAGNRIFSTGDSGSTWQETRRFLPVDFDNAMPELYSVRFSGKKRGWIVGSVSRRDRVVDSLLIYTNDGGASWLRQRVATRSELIHLDFVGEKRGWIVGASGTILYTGNGGETWTPQRSGTTATLYHVDFRNERVGWAVGERSTILRTNDGGETWAEVPVPVRNTLLSVQFIDDDEGWVVGRGGVILRSIDGGRTWVRQESRTAQNLYALFVDKKKGWAVGGDGVVLQYTR
ncbi:MAG TPA: YCF48-related protein [Pyrinomonadaceae bacterium]